jgi:hypothetical protein
MNDQQLAQHLLTYLREMGATDEDSYRLIRAIMAYKRRVN